MQVLPTREATPSVRLSVARAPRAQPSVRLRVLVPGTFAAIVGNGMHRRTLRLLDGTWYLLDSLSFPLQPLPLLNSEAWGLLPGLQGCTE